MFFLFLFGRVFKTLKKAMSKRKSLKKEAAPKKPAPKPEDTEDAPAVSKKWTDFNSATARLLLFATHFPT